ncbi:hypothetical protein [Luteimonas sp. FCS-9]|uniref:hypothetical protein n=1 Tax=Luteimonas sp. FCS-9 TaxID=1547516 RepID=UPI00063ED0E1|nr:hypothetical protein [Luteimonas sp. FCS-9]KLJ02845.1 hypothetical protein WQ56_00760 [Luteimonas sp. FCS-9]
MVKKILGDGDSMDIELKPGVMTQLNNRSTGNWELRVETIGGSVITFTVPAGGYFGINPAGDLVSIKMEVGDLAPRGPRSIDKN